MKILYVLEYYYPHVGGVETLFKKIAESSANQGNTVRVVTTGLDGSYRKEKLNNVEIIRLPLPRLIRRYWFSFLSFFWLLKYARGFDIIHTTVYNAALPAYFIAKIYNIKTIITVHEVWQSLWYKLPDINKISAWLHKCLERLILKLTFDRYIVPSKYTYNELTKFINDKIDLIYHGVDYNYFNKNITKNRNLFKINNINEKFLLIYYGRPGIAKGVSDLVRAMDKLIKRNKNYYLILVLSNDPISNYRNIVKLVSKLNLAGNIDIWDSLACSKLPPVLNSADCVVIPSLSEGFGFSVAECSALSVPVAASNAGSIPEVISGDFQLFEPNNPDSLVKAVERIYQKKYIHKKTVRFEWSNSISKHQEIYSQLIRKEI